MDGYTPEFVALFGERSPDVLRNTLERIDAYIADPSKEHERDAMMARRADLVRLIEHADGPMAAAREVIEERAPGLVAEADAISAEPGRARTAFPRLVDIACERRVAAGDAASVGRGG